MDSRCDHYSTGCISIAPIKRLSETRFKIPSFELHPMTAQTYQDVLSFWFREIDAKSWWAAEPAFDEIVRARFLQLLDQATLGQCASWRADPDGRLAEIIVLDQFSRNIHRGTPAAFAQDALALTQANEAVVSGAHLLLAPVERSFLLMPYMHSESRAVHAKAEILFRDHTPPSNYNFELRHKAIIDRFGRYPHRNEILGRTSTPEELEFLKLPGSSF